MRARHPTLETPYMEQALLQVELIPAEGDELGHAQPMAIGQENHCVIAQAMPPDAPNRLPEAVDFSGGEVLPGADVRIFVALGKRERRRGDLLFKALSCFRCLVPVNRGSTA